MAKLAILPNELTKDQPTQNSQIFMALNDTQNWSNKTLTLIAVDFTEPLGTINESTSSTTYGNLNNFSKIADVSNPLCLISFNLCLKGVGQIALVVNGIIVREVFFQGIGFTTIVHSNTYQLNNGRNTVTLQWKANTGTVEKANISTAPGFNSIQVTSFNS